jgi:hypothetical protein
MLTIAILMTVFLLILLCFTFMMLIDVLLPSQFPIPLIILLLTVGAYGFCVAGTWVMYSAIGH